MDFIILHGKERSNAHLGMRLSKRTDGKRKAGDEVLHLKQTTFVTLADLQARKSLLFFLNNLAAFNVRLRCVQICFCVVFFLWSVLMSISFEFPLFFARRFRFINTNYTFTGVISSQCFTWSENSYERYTFSHDFCRKCERGRVKMCNVRNSFLTWSVLSPANLS